ncbi:arylsulfatase [Pelagicoccus sp. SDUM812005]|uniref:arylsulfatase n=1 Tax=Pelagicoccus sp. SDUM812005 TaxID=3041257 RepID=UPI00280E09FC|nr:arylsulfatase [Pelagicoccus sp. SDUM812005]MDQ8181435.1 arylsulfatase [Pelagicoccus sp. SDUM812005]
MHPFPKRILNISVAALAFALGAGSSLAATRDKPNVILILVDDLGYGDLGSYGQKKIKTPHLDKLGSEGTRFTSAYAGATVCAPSRGSLMTGLHTGHARIRGNSRTVTPGIFLADEDVTIAEVLKSAGYRTAMIGKWGLGQVGERAAGLPRRQGFYYSFGYLNQSHAHNSYPSHMWRNESKIHFPNTVPDENELGMGVSDNKEVFSQDVFMEEVLGFLDEQQGSEDPFFLYFAPTLPHANNESRPFGLEIPDYGDYIDKEWTEAHKAYAAMVGRIDSDVGKIMQRLEALEIDQNTLVIFTSDNGPHQERGADPEFFQSSGPFKGIKRDLYEGGIRVPMIVHWPAQVPAGRVDDTPWYFPDVLPTLAAIAGVEAPEGIDGVDVSPLLLGARQAELEERLLYWEFHERNKPQAARRGDWKAVRCCGSGRVELYFLPNDPGETNDLAPLYRELQTQFSRDMLEARTVSPYWPYPLDGETKQ